MTDKKNKHDHIIEALRVFAVPIESVKPDPANARTGHDVEAIASSLSFYKQRVPIVVNKSEGNKVEKGNGTLAAAKKLGWTHIAAIFVEDDPMTAVGYSIADNRVGDLSTWDIKTLKQLTDAIDPDLNVFTGFDEETLEETLADLAKAAEELLEEIDIPNPKPQIEPEVESDHIITIYCDSTFLPVFNEVVKAWNRRDDVVQIDVS